LGIEVGEVVAIDGGNSPEYLMLWFALDAIGAIVSFVNWNLTGEGLVHCVKVYSTDVRDLVVDCGERETDKDRSAKADT